MKPGDEYKTSFVTPHGQYAYLRMGQHLMSVPHTYFQFNDMVFGYLPNTTIVLAQPSLIGDYGDWRFSLFMDDHIGAAISFEAMFNFLHRYYFSQASSGSVKEAGKLQNVRFLTRSPSFLSGYIMNIGISRASLHFIKYEASSIDLLEFMTWSGFVGSVKFVNWMDLKE